MDEDFLRDLFASLGPIAIRRMFGGRALYRDGTVFALLAFDTIFLKADGETEAHFREAGSRPFSYEAKGRTVTIGSYWSLPEAALDDPDEAARWARLGHAAALRSAQAKSRKALRRRRPAQG
jgi:DNA transformation protein